MLPSSRPALWPLRPFASADVTDELLPDGRRRITIRHAELPGVTPEMLDWWYGHVDGPMEYAGSTWPRYLVWHTFDHIAYQVLRAAPDGTVGPGARLRIREAFQRDPATCSTSPSRSSAATPTPRSSPSGSPAGRSCAW